MFTTRDEQVGRPTSTTDGRRGVPARLEVLPRRPWERAVGGRKICAQMSKYGEMPGNLSDSVDCRGEQVRTKLGTGVRSWSDRATADDSPNQAVSRAESIRRFRILDGEFTVEGGQLSAKQELRRSVLAKELTADIDLVYS